MSRMIARLASCATVLLLVSSCDDDEQTVAEEAIAPTAPAPALSPAVELMSATVKVKGSSVCASYDRERTKLQAELAIAPQDNALLKRASALAAVINDACN